MKSTKLILLLLCAGGIHKASAQKKVAHELSGDTFTPFYEFKKDSIYLTSDCQQQLDKLGFDILSKKLDLDSIELQFKGISYRSELYKDSLIGIKRSIAIINYLCSRYSIDPILFSIGYTKEFYDEPLPTGVRLVIYRRPL
jgi:hypothetical protein